MPECEPRTLRIFLRNQAVAHACPPSPAAYSVSGVGVGVEKGGAVLDQHFCGILLIAPTKMPLEFPHLFFTWAITLEWLCLVYGVLGVGGVQRVV